MTLPKDRPLSVSSSGVPFTEQDRTSETRIGVRIPNSNVPPYTGDGLPVILMIEKRWLMASEIMWLDPGRIALAQYSGPVVMRDLARVSEWLQDQLSLYPKAFTPSAM